MQTVHVASIRYRPANFEETAKFVMRRLTQASLRPYEISLKIWVRGPRSSARLT